MPRCHLPRYRCAVLFVVYIVVSVTQMRLRFGVNYTFLLFYILVSWFSLLTIPYPYHTHTIPIPYNSANLLSMYSIINAVLYLYAVHCTLCCSLHFFLLSSCHSHWFLACFILQNQLEKTTITRIRFEGLQTIRCQLFGAFGSVGWYRALYLCRRGTDTLAYRYSSHPYSYGEVWVVRHQWVNPCGLRPRISE